MKRKNVLCSALAAVLILSGCNSGTAAPVMSESETKSAAETITTEAATTTAAAAATTVTTIAESEKPHNPPNIKAIPASIGDGKVKLNSSYKDERLESDPSTGEIEEEYLERVLSGYTENEKDKHLFFHYVIDPDTYSETVEDKTAKLGIDYDAAEIFVRESTYSFSESKENDIDSRVRWESIMLSDKFPSAYRISWDDPFALLTKATGKETYQYPSIANPEFRKYVSLDHLELGWHTDDIVTVNAFVCRNEGGISVLVDPEYMYGLPMFYDSEYKFNFGGNVIYSDSILFNAEPADGVELNISDYAYAKVKLQYVSCKQIQDRGNVRTENTCTLTEIEIIDEFSDITEYNISSDDRVIAGIDKDPKMKEVYDAVMNVKAEIYKEDTYGIVFLDLDFDGKPEVLVSRLDSSAEFPSDWVLDTDIYRIADQKLKLVGTIPMKYMVVYTPEAFLGLSELNDGTPAWFATVRSRDEQFNSFDCLYTLDGDTLTEHPLFTTKKTAQPLVCNGAEQEYDYYYFDEKIVPNVTMGKDPYAQNDPDAPEDWEYLDWNGLQSTFGMWELFVFIRADYCNNKLKASYPLHSTWMINDKTENYKDKPIRYELTDREFSHKIAYLLDDFYYGGTASVEHGYWFLGAYAKPVIYLYPEEQTDVSVQVNFPLGGELTCTYPEYNDGWNVTALPDGTLYDANGDEYYCLYWEGKSRDVLDDSEGFCVVGSDTAKFLREKLMYIGLSAREANEFIIYWLPKMQDNPYNIITLHTDDYARNVPLSVSPAPDMQIRVFMTYMSSDTPVDIPEQTLPHYERNGFTLVEWGGREEN